ncbi:MAG: hypothetical protein OXH99_20630 [Bryobacterales bacterium]|nr:hypothetical protein [Bryobacterales bacterium]
MDDLVKDRFGTAVALELCKTSRLFELGKLYKRIVIVETLRDEFVKRGGDHETQRAVVARVLKKWLLGPASPFKRETFGRYRFLGFDAATRQTLEAENGGIASGDGSPAPERGIGEGPRGMYAWCLPQYQPTSGDRWPIEIGRAGPEGFRRTLAKIQENIPERPRYVLRLGCADELEARDRESLLRAWFRSRGQKLHKLPGKGWFRTNPSEIADAVRNIIGGDGLRSEESTVEVEDAIASAFKDVTADDWARLPEDLTERLDDHLYGSARA